jgi:hypothetical protein
MHAYEDQAKEDSDGGEQWADVHVFVEGKRGPALG